MSPFTTRNTYLVAGILTLTLGCGYGEVMQGGAGGVGGSTAMVVTGAGGGGAADPDGGAGGTGPNSVPTGGQGGGAAAGAGGAVMVDGGAPETARAPDASGAAGDTGTASTPDSGAAAAPVPPVVYEAESGRISGDADLETCNACSGGKSVSFGEDSVLTLSGVEAGNGGTKMVLLRYTNANERDLSIYVGVNGNASQSFWWIFKPTGGWDKVSSVALALSGFRPGANNTITFFIDTELDAPRLDSIEILPDPSVDGTNYCDRAHWEATASVTAGDGNGPKGAIDGDFKTRWGSNHGQDGSDWFQLDFGGLVKLANVTLDNSQSYADDYPGKYAIYGSVDGVKFDAAPFASGDGKSPRTIVNFTERTVRAIKIMELGTSRAQHWWQIAELTVGCRM